MNASSTPHMLILFPFAIFFLFEFLVFHRCLKFSVMFSFRAGCFDQEIGSQIGNMT